MDPISFPVITAIFAALIAILQKTLMVLVGFERVSQQVGIGDAGNLVLLRKIRRHGNLAESSALMIIIVGLLELAGAAQSIVAALAGFLLFARICHALGFSFQSGASSGGGFTLATWGRTIGALGTFLGTIAASVYLLVLVVPRLGL